MNIFISAIILIVIFGAMVTVHELGHFMAARAFGIHVREFAIGMGPAFFKRQKENAEGNPVGAMLSLRAFPIGGYCDMTEDSESDDPHHFRNQSLWKRCVVLAAGSVMNLLLALLAALLTFLLYLGGSASNCEITGLMESFPYGDKIQVGDVIVGINGNAIYSPTDLAIFVDRGVGAPYTIKLKRGGETVTVENIEPTIPQTVQNKDGTESTKLIFGFNLLGRDNITLPYALKSAWFTSVDNVRLVWLGLSDILTGRAKPSDMMGPLGVGGVVNEIVETSFSIRSSLYQLLSLMSLLSANLAVFNLLPIPALDGGRILLALFSMLLLKIRKKPLDARVEGTLHGVVFLLLIGLMIFVFYNDIRRIFTGFF